MRNQKLPDMGGAFEPIAQPLSRRVLSLEGIESADVSFIFLAQEGSD